MTRAEIELSSRGPVVIEALPPARVGTESRRPPAEYTPRFAHRVAAGAGLEDRTAHLDRRQAVRLLNAPAVRIAGALIHLIHSTPPRDFL
ncbi:hypothetical protein ACWDZ4_22300 [Streptomyces sp. NPDC003016]